MTKIRKLLKAAIEHQVGLLHPTKGTQDHDERLRIEGRIDALRSVLDAMNRHNCGLLSTYLGQI